MLTEVDHPSKYSNPDRPTRLNFRADVGYRFRAKIELHYTNGSSKYDNVFSVNGKSR